MPNARSFLASLAVDALRPIVQLASPADNLPRLPAKKEAFFPCHSRPQPSDPNLFAHLANRNLQDELMDDPSLPQDQHDHALRGLTRIHQFSGLVNRFWKPIQQHLKEKAQASPEAVVRIMDVGCGDAYLLRQIGRKAKAAGLAVELVGADMSSQALELAKEKAKSSGLELNVQQVNVLTQELPPADIIINSLFLHHFTEDQIAKVLAKFKSAAKELMIVEDLRRTVFGYVLCYVCGHLLTRSPIVHYDGMRSVEGALSVVELKSLMQPTGLDTAQITLRWPQRFVIQWRA